MTKAIINSTEYSFFKNLIKVYSNNTHRTNSKKTILDGPHLIQAFMDSGGEVISLVADESVISNEINLIIKKNLNKNIVTLSHELFAKFSGLISVTGLVEIMRQSYIAAGSTRDPLFFYSFAAVLYLLLTYLSMKLLNRQIEIGFI